jgi:nitric oxide dioxygenase
MTMDAKQIQLVRASFARVRPAADQVAALFYQRLFKTAPQLQPLFERELQRQGQCLMSMIELAMRELDDVAGLAPTLHDLGRRHAVYGGRPEDYATVGSALLWALKRSSGTVLTREVKRAWGAVYRALAGVAVYGLLADIVLRAAPRPRACAAAGG